MLPKLRLGPTMTERALAFSGMGIAAVEMGVVGSLMRCSTHACRLIDACVGDPAPASGMLRPTPATTPTSVSACAWLLVNPKAMMPPSRPSRPSWPTESSHVRRVMTARLSESTPLPVALPKR